MLQWHHEAVEPAGDARSDLWFVYHLGRRIRAQAGRLGRRDRPAGAGPDLGLPDPRAAGRARRRGGAGRDQRLRTRRTAAVVASPSSPTTARRRAAAGSTAGATRDGVNQAARRKPGSEQSWVAPDWGWAWPANRRILYNRASADPEGRPWSERKALRLVGRGSRRVDRARRAGLRRRPAAVLPARRRAPPAWPRSPASTRSSCRPTARGGCSRPPALVDGPLPAALRAAGVAGPQPAVRPAAQPGPGDHQAPGQPVPARGRPAGRAVFPYVATTYRLTEHHTAGGMTRWLPYLSELQPEMFCEVSPGAGRRAGPGARRLGHDRHGAGRHRGPGPGHRADPAARGAGPAACTRSGCPTTGAPTGSAPATPRTTWPTWPDPNVHIQEVKALACDIRPGRRPRGPALRRLVQDYQQRAGITDDDRHGGVR